MLQRGRQAVGGCPRRDHLTRTPTQMFLGRLAGRCPGMVRQVLRRQELSSVPSSYPTVISYHSHVEHGDLSQVIHLITEVDMKYLPENHRLGTLKGSLECFTNTKIKSFAFFQCMYPANKPLYRLP